MPAISNQSHNRLIPYLAALLVAGSLLVLVWDTVSSPAMESRIVRYDAIGDSITFGEPLGFTVDEQGRPRKSAMQFQGWPELLEQMLTDATQQQTEVFNNGHPGDRVRKSRAARLPGFFDGKSKADRALLLIGTNDSHEFETTVSGLTCTDTDSCDGTYKWLMESVIDELKDAGRERIYVGLLPPIFGSLSAGTYADPLDLAASPRNAWIREYNQVVADILLEIPGVRAGPDFFSCFLSSTVNRYSLYEDTLHPNELGYVFMAALWRDAIIAGPVSIPMDPCPAPIYIVESLDPYTHGHKQNLLEPGDQYYTDESHTLVSVPPELEEGVWVLQANADNSNADKSFVSFNVGADPVSVYIAYDPSGNPPSSTTHAFAPAVLSGSLDVSDSAVGTMHVVVANDVTGTIAIGGTKSGGTPGPQQAYIVVVVP